MRPSIVLAAAVAWLCAACASTPIRFAGRYDRTDHIYYNNTAGFHLAIPPHWSIATKPRDFTVPQHLRADQEQVLEAYNPDSKLGLVIVVQQGPLDDIANLVRKMRAVPEAQLTHQLTGPSATDFRQLAIRHIVVTGHETAEWIYTITDTTGGQSVDVTVSSYIIKVGENYVYITFSIPSTRYADSRQMITTMLATFDTSAASLRS